jgi:nitric oxide reductase NorQ protein
VQLGGRLRLLRDRGLAEVPSTRLLVATARLIVGDIPVEEACRVALLAPLTDDPELLAGMRDLVSASLA